MAHRSKSMALAALAVSSALLLGGCKSDTPESLMAEGSRRRFIRLRLRRISHFRGRTLRFSKRVFRSSGEQSLAMTLFHFFAGLAIGSFLRPTPKSLYRAGFARLRTR